MLSCIVKIIKFKREKVFMQILVRTDKYCKTLGRKYMEIIGIMEIH